MKRLAAGTLFVAALSWATSADADCSSATHLSTCFDADNFWPHAGPGDFDFVGGTATTTPGTFGFAIHTTYVARPIVLLVPSADPSGAEAVAVDHLWDTTVGFSLGLTRRIDASLALPVAVYRSGIGISALTHESTSSMAHTAMRDMRIGATVRVLGSTSDDPCEPPFRVAARFELSLPTGDESSFAGDKTFVAIPSVSAETREGPFFGGAEVGARYRATADLVGSRVGPQLYLGAALGVEALPARRLAFTLEAMALPALVAQNDLSLDTSTGERQVSGSRPYLVPAEWQAVVRSAEVLADGLAFGIGAGTPIGVTGESGVTTPRYRATLSIRYAPPVPHTPAATEAP